MTTIYPANCKTTGNPGSPVHPTCSLELIDEDAGTVEFTDGTGPCSVHTGWTADEVIAEAHVMSNVQNAYISGIVVYFDEDRNPIAYHP